jgi:hypothetical protein
MIFTEPILAIAGTHTLVYSTSANDLETEGKIHGAGGKMTILEYQGNFYMFIFGAMGPLTFNPFYPLLYVLNFGNSINNTPILTQKINLHDLDSALMLIGTPRGDFAIDSDGLVYGFYVPNHNTLYENSKARRIQFSANLSVAPTLSPFNLNLTTGNNQTQMVDSSCGDIHIIKDGADYYALYESRGIGNDDIHRFSFGNSLKNNFTIRNWSGFGNNYGQSFPVFARRRLEASTIFQDDSSNTFIFLGGRESGGNDSIFSRLYFPAGALSMADEEDFYNPAFYNSIELFQWGSNRINDCVINGDSFADLLNYRGLFRDILFESHSIAFNNQSNELTIIQRCEFTNALLKGNVLNDTIIDSTQFASAGFEQQNIANGIIAQKRLESGFSNLETALNLANMSNGVLVFGKHLGVLYLAASATQNITALSSEASHPITIINASAFTINFIHSSNLECRTSSNFALASGKRCTFQQFKGEIWSQVDILDPQIEFKIPLGTTAQYWRGDKSWQTLNKTSVGLSNVDNTTDVSKPISTATQTALNLKADLVGGVIPTSQIPAVAISQFLGTVANQTAMLTLIGQRGDWCIRSDNSMNLYLGG